MQRTVKQHVGLVLFAILTVAGPGGIRHASAQVEASDSATGAVDVLSFETVADMRKASGLEVGRRLETFYFHASIHSYWIVQETLGEDEFGVKLADGNYARLDPGPRLNVLAFGAAPGESDSSDAIQAAVDLAIARSREHFMQFPGASDGPAVEVFFPGYRFQIDRPITNRGWGRLTFAGEGRTLIFRNNSGESDAFLFELTGDGYNINFRDLNLAATAAGCIDLCSNNKSSSMVEFVRCRFIYNPETYTATGVVIDNQSSSIAFRHCLFQNIKHPVHVVNCDFTLFSECWFGYPRDAVYKDRGAMIKHDAGFMKVSKCLFAGGPAHGKGGAEEVAYFNVGVEFTDGPEHRALLLVEGTRIAFEWGAGAIANFFADPRSSSGIMFRNNMFSPREEKVKTIRGFSVSPLVRLFTMPRILTFEDSISTHVWGLVGAGSTTSLKALRRSVGGTMPGTADLSRINDVRSGRVFKVSGMSTTRNIGFVAATEDRMEYNRWAEMFGVFNDFFTARPDSSERSVIIDTFYKDFSEPGGALYEIKLGAGLNAEGTVSQVMAAGTAAVVRTGETVSGHFVNRLGQGGVPGSDKLAVKVLFVVDGREFERLSLDRARRASLRLKVTASDGNVTAIDCEGAVIRSALLEADSKTFHGTPMLNEPHE